MRGRATINGTHASPGGAGQMKKAVGWILLALLIFYIGTNPREAADTARGLGDGIETVFTNIGTFFSELSD
jgi:hypothetical protein